jgi:hypothetical protein
MNNDSNKDTCYGDLVGLHKTWLNITKNVDNIKRSMHKIRQVFVTMSLPNTRVHLRMSTIEAELSSILEAIAIQQKVTGYEYPLGDITKTVNKESVNIIPDVKYNQLITEHSFIYLHILIVVGYGSK